MMQKRLTDDWTDRDRERTRVGHVNEDSPDVYIGRGNDGTDIITASEPGEHGWLGNPFRLEAHGGDYTREESIEEYRRVFQKKLDDDDEFREAVEALRGDVLGGWCRSLEDDEPACHGDVIKE